MPAELKLIFQQPQVGNIAGGARGFDLGDEMCIRDSIYLLSGRNLWVPILAHGRTDTVAVVAIFMGWAT